MIILSNGHSFEYMAASGALGFDGRGWWWEKPLVALGLIKPELFTVVLRTLTRQPRLYPVSNLSWIRPWTWLPWSPWSCVRFLPGGAVNKVGLYNPGIDWWRKEVGPRLDYKKVPLVGSVFGEEDELIEMAEMFNEFNLVGLEVNVSCHNVKHPFALAEKVVTSVKSVRKHSRHPIIVKVGVDEKRTYLDIAKELRDEAEAISLNSVAWEIVFPYQRSPLWKLEKTGGGGGVSGHPAQKHNWKAVRELAAQGFLPVIGPSVMEFEDLFWLRKDGAEAISFGAIHLRTPWKPTRIVKRELRLLRKPRAYKY